MDDLIQQTQTLSMTGANDQHADSGTARTTTIGVEYPSLIYDEGFNRNKMQAYAREMLGDVWDQVVHDGLDWVEGFFECLVPRITITTIRGKEVKATFKGVEDDHETVDSRVMLLSDVSQIDDDIIFDNFRLQESMISSWSPLDGGFTVKVVGELPSLLIHDDIRMKLDLVHSNRCQPCIARRQFEYSDRCQIDYTEESGAVIERDSNGWAMNTPAPPPSPSSPSLPSPPQSHPTVVTENVMPQRPRLFPVSRELDVIDGLINEFDGMELDVDEE